MLNARALRIGDLCGVCSLSLISSTSSSGVCHKSLCKSVSFSSFHDMLFWGVSFHTERITLSSSVVWWPVVALAALEILHSYRSSL